MTEHEAELESIFHADVQTQLQRALIQCLFGAYRVSDEEVCHFPPEEKKDIQGHYRWVQLRYLMRGLADRFPGIVASAEPYHTLITAGRIKLIAASAGEPGGPIRPANYKLEYANNSLDLFDQMPELPPHEGGYHFTILQHGVDVRERSQPAFARIIFVRKDMKPIHHFDLFRLHYELVNSLWIKSKSDDDLDIRLREDDEEKPL